MRFATRPHLHAVPNSLSELSNVALGACIPHRATPEAIGEAKRTTIASNCGVKYMRIQLHSCPKSGINKSMRSKLNFSNVAENVQVLRHYHIHILHAFLITFVTCNISVFESQRADSIE